MAKPSPWLGVLRWGLSALLLAVVIAQLATRWHELAERTFTFAWQPAILACLGLTAFFLLGCDGWRRLAGALAPILPYPVAFRVLFLSNLAKYLPAGVLNLAGRVVLGRKAGVPMTALAASIIMEIICQVVAALFVALLMLPAVVGLVGPLVPAIAGLDMRFIGLAIVVVLGALHPALLDATLAAAERASGRPLPRVPYRYGFVLFMVAYYTANWLLLGGSFACLGQALSPTPLDAAHLALLVGAFVIAWNVGVFALFAPAGLGVREAALVLLLSPAFPAGFPAVLALVARVWLLAGEVITFGLAFALPEAKVAEVAEDEAQRPVGV